MKLFFKIIIGLILIGLGAALWLNKAHLFGDKQSTSQVPAVTNVDHHHKSETTPENVSVEEKKSETENVVKKNSNAAADGLSRYYANLHGEMDGKGPKIRNNIVYLSEPEGDLALILEERRINTRPLRRSWTGNTDNHPFRLGETLYQKLTEYSKINDVELIWWLNRDFIVKSPFRINKDIIKTSYQVGKAIEGHFENGLSIYFCYQQRAIVLIEYDIPYLAKECLKLPKDKSY
ncbi:MAG: TcpQ domain-containing protein [Colwellia polaris]|jgi:hypothetical protein|uniref:TcpQ domain-containing protein n=1 Tax=Colwellia polaris TaxID=326537 RepID=UPI000A1768CE|nr:TcpQ domain-containing protein [Colwellia polaris]|tara:strand:- start:3770 stop:4471 length:702 start_codon:yes stop_codon:yes gene_type:complete